MSTRTYYKILGGPKGLTPVHGGRGDWSPRKWMPAVTVDPCRSGYHVCAVGEISKWITADATVWAVAVRGDVVASDGKHVAAEARLVRRVGRLTREVLVAWAADCAERVLPLYEARCPGDYRPRRAIAAARSGDRAAARAAAWAASAARDAAWAAASAARDAAERQWQGERLLAYLRGEVTP